MRHTYPWSRDLNRGRHTVVLSLLFGVLVAGTSVVVPGFGDPYSALAHVNAVKRDKSIAKVSFIYKGLSVQPPHKKLISGKRKMPLFTQYFLQTKTKQRASVAFKDGTTLHMNELTDAVLRNPHVTYVKKGEIVEDLTPGTNHQVRTATAIASAIGTRFDVLALKQGSAFLVVHGALLVKNKLGSTVVTTNHESVVFTNKPPQPPQPVDASQKTNWTKGMPTPKHGENVALQESGARVVGYSSQYVDPTQGDFWSAKYINDGDTTYGWATDSGRISNEWVKIQLAGGKTYKIGTVIIDPGATHGDSPTSDLKHFEIRVSTTGTADTDFHTVYSGVCQQSATLQSFTFDQPVDAKYVELFAVDNYGSPDWISVAEFEVINVP